MERSKISVIIGQLRGVRSQEEVGAAIGVSRETIKHWENGTRNIKADDIIKLADYFHVSADYLLGRTLIKSPKEDLQAVCKYTGLSEEAVEVLHVASVQTNSNVLSDVAKTSAKTLNFLNHILRLSYRAVDYAKKGVEIPVLTIFTDMEEYVSAKKVLLFPNDEGVDEAYGKKELYLEVKMSKLRKILESLMDAAEKEANQLAEQK